MESLLIYPKNKEQLKMLKAVLKALKVQFEPHCEKLPAHVIASIEKGLKQAENGQTISYEEFKEKHFSKK